MSSQDGTSEPVPLGECIAELLSVLDGARPQSRFHIETANQAAALGMPGSLLVTLPTRASDAPEARWLGGRYRLQAMTD